MSERDKAFYDPKYNYYPGYHGQVVLSTKDDFDWQAVDGMVVNRFEISVISEDPEVRKKYVSAGEFKNVDSGLVFSPHILPIHTNQGQYVFMEIEHVNWLFGDTYEEVAQRVPPWKIKIFNKLVMNPNLQHIFWWSQSAFDRFFHFADDYHIPPEVIARIIEISSVLLPCSEISEKSARDTSGNHLITTFSEEQFFRKGGDLLADIVTRMQSMELPPWQLTIVGSVPPEYRSTFSRDNIRTIPHVSYDKFQRLLSSADIFIMPSRADTFGLSALEALNKGLYIIASSGPAVIATREFLRPYPNHILIESRGNNGIYDILDETAFMEVVVDIIRNPKILLPFESPYTRERMRAELLSYLK